MIESGIVKSISIYDELDEYFNLEDNGWLGSDIAHSIKLNQSLVLWLFGDTFIGKKMGDRRSNDWTFINNSIVLMQMENNIINYQILNWMKGNKMQLIYLKVYILNTFYF